MRQRGWKLMDPWHWRENLEVEKLEEFLVLNRFSVQDLHRDRGWVYHGFRGNKTSNFVCGLTMGVSFFQLPDLQENMWSNTSRWGLGPSDPENPVNSCFFSATCIGKKTLDDCFHFPGNLIDLISCSYNLYQTSDSFRFLGFRITLRFICFFSRQPGNLELCLAHRGSSTLTLQCGTKRRTGSKFSRICA